VGLIPWEVPSHFGPRKEESENFEKKSAVKEDQEKGSATTTYSLGCTHILEVMTQSLPFSPISPLGPILTQFMATTKETDEVYHPLKIKNTSSVEVETP
jgi:hypothetical protein